MKNKMVYFTIILICCFDVGACESIVNHLAFHPDTTTILPVESLPKMVQDIFFTTIDKEKLHGYWVRSTNSKHILIYFHGNAGNIVHRLSDILQYHKLGISVLCVDYRGYGKSTGAPDEEGLYLDGQAAYQYAINRLGFQVQNIFVLGRSIGTAVAVHISQNQKIAGLILVTPLTSGKAHAKSQGFGPFAYIAGNSFDNFSKVINIICPVLVIHGTHDRVIPYSMGLEIFQKAKVEKKLITIDNAGHNDLSDRQYPKYWSSIHNFILKY